MSAGPPSGALDAHVEVVKLARLLDSPAERFAALAAVDAAELRALREQIVDALFGAHRAQFERVAALTRHVPPQISARLAERALGPLLSAQVVGLIDPDRAAELAKRLPPRFLADVAVALDPRRASAVIARTPADRVAAGAAELARRGEYVAMGGFVGHLSAEGLAATLDVLDAEALLRTGFVLEAKDRLGDMVAQLSDERLAAMIDVAAEQELWPELLDLVERVGRRERTRLARLMGDAADEAIDSALALLAGAPDLHSLAADLVGRMRAPQRRRVAARADALGLSGRLGALGEALG